MYGFVAYRSTTQQLVHVTNGPLVVDLDVNPETKIVKLLYTNLKLGTQQLFAAINCAKRELGPDYTFEID